MPNISQKLKSEDYDLIFGAIMQHSKDGLFVTDHTGKVVMLNRAAEQMYDIEAAQVLGRNVRDLVKEGFWDRAVFLDTVAKQRPLSLIVTTRSRRKILSTGIPVYDKANNLRFVLMNERDISFISHLVDALESREPHTGALQLELSDYGLAAAEMEGIVVRSPAMADVLQMALRAARFDIPLVLSGESGVGKTLIARLIHRCSNRRRGPFLDLNCGAIADNLLESELFGHERGAFTGAAATGKKGLFELAQNGTLFLDEISEIPLALQVKLLKFLESRELLRVGGLKPIRVDARILAATNCDLQGMVAEGKFRSDLFFRLNVVPIDIPPLRERGEDVEPLALFFLDRFNREFGTRKQLSVSARTSLKHYDFPGNVRELENLIKRLVTMTEADLIRVKHLPEMLRQTLKKSAIRLHTADVTPYQQAVAVFERKIILEAIRRHGSQRKAAKALGLNQSTLSRKLKLPDPEPFVH